jgi:hypothetical protein
MIMLKLFFNMKTLYHLLLFLFLIPVFADAQTYSTDFKNTENPVSEQGRWRNGKHDGLDWTDVRIIDGMACGTQSGIDTGITTYNDSYAILSGFSPDQTAQGIVRIKNQTALCNQEVELLLRWNSSAHRATGYECLTRCLNSNESYMEIVRWNGALGDFTYLARLHSSTAGLKDGDTLKASVTGNKITFYHNNILKLQCTDNTYPEGNPGIGFFLAGCHGTNTDFGFTSFTVKGLKNDKDARP